MGRNAISGGAGGVGPSGLRGTETGVEMTRHILDDPESIIDQLFEKEIADVESKTVEIESLVSGEGSHDLGPGVVTGLFLFASAGDLVTPSSNQLPGRQPWIPLENHSGVVGGPTGEDVEARGLESFGTLVVHLGQWHVVELHGAQGTGGGVGLTAELLAAFGTYRHVQL